MINQKLLNLIDENYEKIVADRRYIHQNPEISSYEVNTSNYIKNILDELNIPYRANVGGYGVVGLIEGKEDGPTIMIRADMDALPIQEETGLSFSSNTDNVMHACGHDVHTSNLLGIARVLNEFKDEMHGNVKLCFQPAEEGRDGSLGMLKDGVLENPKVDYSIGMHIDPSIELGQAAIEVGPVTAYPDFFSIKFTGNGGHGSVPFKSIDPILPAVRLYDMLNSISKEISPLNPNVIQICAFNAGALPAAIPDICEIKGTVRTHFQEDRLKIKDRIFEFTEHIAKLYNVKHEIDFWGGEKPVVNDEKFTKIAQELSQDIFDKGLVKSVDVKLAGEDYSTFSDVVPSTFLVVGCSNEEDKDRYALHNCRFNPDERVLKYSVAGLSNIALNFLNVKEKDHF